MATNTDTSVVSVDGFSAVGPGTGKQAVGSGGDGRLFLTSNRIGRLFEQPAPFLSVRRIVYDTVYLVRRVEMSSASARLSTQTLGAVQVTLGSLNWLIYFHRHL